MADHIGHRNETHLGVRKHVCVRVYVKHVHVSHYQTTYMGAKRESSTAAFTIECLTTNTSFA